MAAAALATLANAAPAQAILGLFEGNKAEEEYAASTVSQLASARGRDVGHWWALRWHGPVEVLQSCCLLPGPGLIKRQGRGGHARLPGTPS